MTDTPAIPDISEYIAQHCEEIILQLPWSLICAMAGKAMLDGLSFDAACEKAIKTFIDSTPEEMQTIKQRITLS